MADVLDFAVDFVLNEELEASPRRMARLAGLLNQDKDSITPFSSYRGPEKKTTDESFAADILELRAIQNRGGSEFKKKFKLFREKHNPTVSGTNLGDNTRWQKFVKDVGPAAAVKLTLTEDVLDEETVKRRKRKELAKDEAYWKLRTGSKAWSRLTSGTQAALISAKNNSKGSFSNTAKFIKSKDFSEQELANQFSKWKRAKTHKKRVSRELQLFGATVPKTKRIPPPKEEFQRQVDTSVQIPEVQAPRTLQLGQPGSTLDVPAPAVPQPQSPLLNTQQEQEALALFDQVQQQAQPQVAELPAAGVVRTPVPSETALEGAFTGATELATPTQAPGPVTTTDAEQIRAAVDAQGKAIANQIVGSFITGAGLGAPEAGIQAFEAVTDTPLIDVFSDPLGPNIAMAKAFVRAARRGVSPNFREELANFQERLTQKRAERVKFKEDFPLVDLAADVIGGLTTSSTLFRLGRAGLSAVGFGARLERLEKFGRVIGKGRAAVKGGKLSLDRARQVHAVTQAAIKQRLVETAFPTLVSAGATGFTGAASRSLFGDVAEGEEVDVERAAKAGLFGAGFSLAAGTAGLGLGAAGLLKRAPKAVSAFRLADEQQLLQDIAVQSTRGVNKLVKAGKLKPEQRAGAIYGDMMQKMQAAGIKIQPNFKFGFGSNWFMRQAEKWNRADKAFKTRTAEVIDQAIRGDFQMSNIKADLGNRGAGIARQLEKTGLTPGQITRALRYFETVDETGDVFFNRLPRGGKNIRAAWENSSTGRELGELTEAQRTYLTQLRRWFNETAETSPRFAEKLGSRRIQGYVPLYSKDAFKNKAALGGTFEGIENLRAAKERLPNVGFDSRRHEDNIYKVLDAYTTQLAKHEAFSSLRPAVHREFIKFRMLGRDDLAQEFMDTMARTMRVRTKRDFVKEFGSQLGTDIYDSNLPLINQIAASMPDRPDFGTKLLDALHDATFKNLVFTRPSVMIKQFLQPQLVGSAEIGGRWVTSGSKSWTTGDDVGKLAKQMMPLMRAKDASALREAVLSPEAGFKDFKKVLGFLGKPGEVLFNKLDTRNRGVMFAGAYKQLGAAIDQGAGVGTNQARALLDDAMDGLLSGEKALITRTWERQGQEAARRMYGIIRSRRANFAYSLADTPKLFSEGAGRFIPFTTWSGNMLMRFVGDVTEGNTKTLAKRLAYPLVALAAMRGLTGYEVPNAEPFTAVPGAFGLNVFPAITGPIEQLARRGPAAASREFLKFTSPGQAAEITGAVSSALQGKARESDISRITGFKPIDQRDPVQVLLPQMFRKFVTDPQNPLTFLPSSLKHLFR